MPNYLKLIKIPKNQTIKKEMHIWELDEFQIFLKIFETNPNILYQTFFMFQYYTGNRLMETLALSEDDLKNNCVNVNKSIINKTLDNTLYKIVPTKNYTVRQVPLPSVLLEQIKIYLKWKRDNNILSQYLFGGNTIMSGSTIRRVFAKYTKIAGLKPIRIHDLRHSYVSALIHLGITTKVIASLIGDREEQVIKTYSHLYLDDKDNAIVVLNTALNKFVT